MSERSFWFEFSSIGKDMELGTCYVEQVGASNSQPGHPYLVDSIVSDSIIR